MPRRATGRPDGGRVIAPMVVAIMAITTLCISAISITAGPSAASGSSRAGIVVDFGDGVAHKVGISFSGSLSGVQALDNAFDPVVQGFSGLGAAVCAIGLTGGDAIGCPSGPSCLTCDAPRSWIYFRSTAGTSGFTFSRAGAGATTVHDGDIEGWRYGTGTTPPAWSAIDTFFGPPQTTSTNGHTTTTAARQTTTTANRSTSSTHPTSTGTPTTIGAASIGSPTTAGPIGSASTTGAPGANTAAANESGSHAGNASHFNDASSFGSRHVGDAANVARKSSTGLTRNAAGLPIVHRHRDGGPGGQLALIGFATVIALVIGAIVALRRKNRLLAGTDAL